MRRLAAWALVLATLPPSTAVAKAASGGGPASVIGAWQSRSAEDVVGLVLEPVVDRDGCLRLTGSGRFELDDHPSVKRGLFWKPHKVKPGRYAIAAVRWAAVGYPTSYYGLSRQSGALWTFMVDPAAVTDIGVWRITSRYVDRYVVEDFDILDSQADARGQAKGVGPLVLAHPVRAPVAETTAPCPS